MTDIKVISKSTVLGKYAKDFGRKAKVNVYNKGDIRFRSKGIKWDFSMLSIWFGQNEWKDLELQTADTIRFLKRYGRVFDRMHCENKGLDVFVDYPAQCRLGKKLAVQQDKIPLELIHLCSKHKIYINIALYS